MTTPTYLAVATTRKIHGGDGCRGLRASPPITAPQTITTDRAETLLGNGWTLCPVCAPDGPTAATLFDPGSPSPAVQGETRRDAAIRRAADAAPESWWAAAAYAIMEVAEANPDGFTTDEVWAWLEANGHDAPPEPRAMGSAMTQAKNGGAIVPTDRIRPTVRPGAHRRPCRVWVAS